MSDDTGRTIATDRYVSTGALPRARVAEVVDLAHREFRDNADGAVSTVYPALSEADSEAFGLCLAGTDATTYEAGDSRAPFTIMSVAKPFVFALVCREWGVAAVRERVGVNATGLPFNSIEAVERSPGGRTNPMVNSGAIATTSLVPGASLEDRWAFVLDGLSRFAGRDLALDERMYASAIRTNHRNRALAALLRSEGGIAGDPADAAELYTRQSCLTVTACDLAMMGATLADGGVCPTTQQRVIDADAARATLAVMTIAGLYETSGEWLLDVGIPGKSGIGGGIVTVSPGKGALGTYAPRLDAAGNSIKGQLAARFLARHLGLDVLASQPVSPAGPPHRSA
jgi:glutaminase